jgi:hypothetical protein
LEPLESITTIIWYTFHIKKSPTTTKFTRFQIQFHHRKTKNHINFPTIKIRITLILISLPQALHQNGETEPRNTKIKRTKLNDRQFFTNSARKKLCFIWFKSFFYSKKGRISKKMPPIGKFLFFDAIFFQQITIVWYS